MFLSVMAPLDSESNVLVYSGVISLEVWGVWP